MTLNYMNLKAQMLCLGFEPTDAEFQAQTDPLYYDVRLALSNSCQFILNKVIVHTSEFHLQPT